MNDPEPPTRRLIGRFLFTTLGWAVVLSVVGLAINVVNAPAVNLRPGAFFELLTGNLGLFLLFGSFAGGIAAHAAGEARVARSVSVLGGLVTGVMAFGIIAYAEPIAEHRAGTLRGYDMELRAPFGPSTPGGRLAHLRYLGDNPPAVTSLSADTPLQHPRNWTEHLLHLQLAMPLLALIFGLLGHLVGEITDPVRPSRRRHLRWALGVLSVVVFVAPAQYIGSYVRSTLDAPGALTAWSLLLPSMALLAVAWGVAEARIGIEPRRRNRFG